MEAGIIILESRSLNASNCFQNELGRGAFDKF